MITSYKYNITDADYADSFTVLRGNDSFNKLDIFIKESPNTEPHILVRDERGLVCSISLLDSNYVRFPEIDPNHTRLDNVEEAAFASYMLSIPGGELTIWEYLVSIWNKKNPNNMIVAHPGCPHYNTIDDIGDE